MSAGAGTPAEVETIATGHRIRPAMPADLPTCAAIWRESLNDYLGRLAQAEIPDDLGPILRLYAHLQATDPTTFLVAEPAEPASPAAPSAHSGGLGEPDAASIDGFVVVLQRDGLRFLSMLFIRPEAQGRGLGKALLTRAMPSPADKRGEEATSPTPKPERISRATATDSVQPISNALYASLGMVPRIPLLRLVGLPARPASFPPLPAGIEAVGFDEVDDDPAGLGRSALAAELEALDRGAAGFARGVDHGYHRREGRIGFLFRDRSGEAVGYGYSSEAGRVGPIAVRDPALLGPLVGHLVGAIRPRGAFGIWVPGSADQAIVPLLQAGFRLDGFPVLLCWDLPFADFTRYVPMSPGLL